MTTSFSGRINDVASLYINRAVGSPIVPRKSGSKGGRTRRYDLYASGEIQLTRMVKNFLTSHIVGVSPGKEIVLVCFKSKATKVSFNSGQLEPKQLCCKFGQVPPINPATIEDEKFLELYQGKTDFSKNFLRNILGFNLVFSFTSLRTSGKLEHEYEKSISYKIQANRRKREAEMYQENEDIVRIIFNYLGKNNDCLAGMLKELESVKELISHHVDKNKNIPEVSIVLKTADGVQTREHKGLYHLPSSTSFVGGIVNLDAANKHLQIAINSPNPGTKSQTRFLSHENIFYDSFQYPLLIPHGNVGYSHSQQLLKVDGKKQRINVRITPSYFYTSMYMERQNMFNYVTKSRGLFQQFVVDNYIKMESMGLLYIELNQSNIRKERTDILRCEDGKIKGQRIIIPPTYIGGPRYMKQRQQDALAYVSNYGSPDFFITFTMNPAWEELSKAAEQTGGTSTNKGDRPDLISRIFKQKVDGLINNLAVKNIFGKVKAFLYSIEWQKRGLPHVHILLWMRHAVNAEFVSKIISAELPDKDKEPELFDIVTKCLIHGPCKGFDESHLCCQQASAIGGKECCGKGFPKPCRDTLLYGNNGYPMYKRRAIGDGGNSFKKFIKGKEITVDNSWVVPYNPYLCLKYNAHINVECSNSIKAIAYVTKYVNKGCDRILYSKTGEGEVINEIKNYQDSRYVNSNEATWRIFRFPIHRSYPPVVALDLHLEGENGVFFRENVTTSELEKKIEKDTHLTAFF
ncbi:uncharacterized protein LOC143039746 [Oratosquilla oratoria]|uniref:uncharacterized protein LOC143039746 n=1 Tax=Oratosquilla oratoria TaxID=337810 RepID=UPI003F768BAB